MEKKSKKNNRRLVAVLAVILCVIVAFIGVIIYYHASKSHKAETTSALTSSESAGSTSKQHSDKTDAEKYYKENSQKLISVTPAEKSKKVYSEKQVTKELSSRGFGKTDITYDYGINGIMNDKTEANKTSDTTHPQYTVTYTAKNGDYWNISICENSITAYPVTYNLKKNGGAELIIAESGSITAYDSQTNSFYDVIPKQSVLLVKQIPSITAEALERLTPQEIDKL